MRRSLRASIAVFALLLSLLVGPAVVGATANPGNSDAAKLCQDGGFANYVRSDGTAFKNTGDCVSYAAQGGELKPKATLSVSVDNTTCAFTTSGSGLLPGSQVTYVTTAGVSGTNPGFVQPDGTYSFSGIGYPQVGEVFATTAGGAIISAPYSICMP